MNHETAQILNSVNRRFYAEVSESFSKTRQSSWAGWNLCLHVADLASMKNLKVLDVACGNQRFADYISRVLPQAEIEYVGVDAEQSLAEEYCVKHECATRIKALDVVEATLAGTIEAQLKEASGLPLANVVSCFGFMHHVPTFEARKALLRALIEACDPQGYCFVSFWRFVEEPRLAKKALAQTTEGLQALGLDAGALDENDYLLGWQDREGVYRYCHYFDDKEISALSESVDDIAAQVACFKADGRTSVMNSYLVFQRR